MTDNLKATIYINRGAGELNPQHRKENNFMAEYAAIDRESGDVVVTLRIYGTNARNYACVWINSGKEYINLSGSGFAGGYGYHRPSQAAENALLAANIELSERIGGLGERMTSYAVRAVAVALGYPNAIIHRAHA